MRRLLVLLCLGCTESPGEPAPPSAGTPVLQLISAQLIEPVFATSPPGDSARLFVVEKAGRVRIIRRDTLLGGSFFDIRGQIATTGEQGLLSIAFHPDYATNGRFYVYFTDSNGDLRIVRYTVSATDPNVASTAGADTLLTVSHPGQTNHNGGQLQFGPDGMLYAALGDGGGGGDVPNNAQNRHQLLGKMVRLDVAGASGYAVPFDNPFVNDTAYEREIWALGLRNPWRFSFDRLTGDLFIADVGQGAWEEVNGIRATGGGVGAARGVNFGWRIMEGLHCFPPTTMTCDQTGLTLPLLEYSISGTECAVAGGYVYRGTRVTQLVGHYVYSDYCAGWVRTFRFVGGAATDQQDRSVHLSPGGQVTSFGEDGRGELYIMTLRGTVYRIVEAN